MSRGKKNAAPLSDGVGHAVVGVHRYVAVADLRLDEKNPRFPVDADGDEQSVIATQIADRYDAIHVARRIAREGYHAADTPAVVENPDGTFLVLEGNRRTTALKGMLDADLRAGFADAAAWNKVAAEAQAARNVPVAIPVTVYESREAAQPLLGARHMQGQLLWEPLSRGRYIAERMDDGASWNDTADNTGMTPGEAKKAYRNYRLVTVDLPRLGLDFSKRIEGKYSVLELVWNNRVLREYAHVLPISAVTVGGSALDPTVEDADAKKRLAEVLGWVVGTEKVEPVMPESRDIKTLAKVVASEVGQKALGEGATLVEALQQVTDAGAEPLDASTRGLNAAITGLQRVASQVELLDVDERAGLASLVAAARAALDAVAEALEGCEEQTGE